MKLEKWIREVPDFPKPGIIFRDITPLLRNAEAFCHSIDQLALPFQGKKIDVIIGIESRGFIFAAPLAQKLQAGFAPARKKQKLPWETIRVNYQLEYGTDSIELHKDALARGQNVWIVDDLLGTGGTMKACCELVEKLGGNLLGCSCLIELKALNGRSKLGKTPFFSVLSY